MGPHSYDPGVSPSLVFWNTAISPGSVKVDFKRETASLRLKDVLVFDVFTVPNSLDPNHPLGKVNSIINSLRIDWSDTTRDTTFSNCHPNAFRGRFFEDSATIQVTVTTPPTPARSCPITPARNGPLHATAETRRLTIP